MLVLGHALALGVPSPHAPAALAGRELGTAVLTARASGWTLDPRVYEEPGQFTGCPDGQRNADESECLAAVQAATAALGLVLDGSVVKVVNAGADGWVPSGCSYSRGHGLRAMFNRNPAGRNWGSYPLVCIEGEVQPPGATLPNLGLNQSYPEQFNPVYAKAFGPALVGWAAHAMQEIEQQFMCNVSRLGDYANAKIDHPAFRGNLTNLLLPAGVHLLLFGSSHIESVRNVLLSVARYLGRIVTTDYISRPNFCEYPEHPLGFSGPENRVCGMHLETACKSASLVVDTYEPCDGCGIATMTTIQNHPQYQVPGHESNLDALLRDAQPPFTHGYYTQSHDPAYFDAHCEFARGGEMPDPSKVGDRVETPCDPMEPSCQPAMLSTIQKYLPDVGVRGGLALHRNDGDSNNSTLVRIAKSYEADLLPKPDGHPGLSAHACNVICQPGVACLPGEGLGIAWEVLRSAGLQECDSSCPCDSVDGWHLWSDRMMAGDGFNELASEMSVISERAAAAKAAAAEKLAAAKAAEEERRLTAAAAAEKAAAEKLGIPYT